MFDSLLSSIQKLLCSTCGMDMIYTLCLACWLLVLRVRKTQPCPFALWYLIIRAKLYGELGVTQVVYVLGASSLGALLEDSTMKLNSRAWRRVPLSFHIITIVAKLVTVQHSGQISNQNIIASLSCDPNKGVTSIRLWHYAVRSHQKKKRVEPEEKMTCMVRGTFTLATIRSITSN